MRTYLCLLIALILLCAVVSAHKSVRVKKPADHEAASFDEHHRRLPPDQDDVQRGAKKSVHYHNKFGPEFPEHHHTRNQHRRTVRKDQNGNAIPDFVRQEDLDRYH